LNPSIREPLPPDMLEADRTPLADASSQNDEATSALLMPVAARAWGGTLFPRHAVHDVHAGRILARLGVDAATLCRHRPAIYAELSRTRIFQARGAAFLDRHPRSLGVSLGAGLGHCFQWLDRGSNAWLDVERPEVHAMRQQLLPQGGRHLNSACDIAGVGWWSRLGLPTGPYERPVLLLLNASAMDLQPDQLLSMLHEIGAQAPPGSQVLVDAQSRWAARCNRQNVADGLPCLTSHARTAELPHPRLRLDAAHAVMAGCGWPYTVIQPVHQLVFGRPFHVIAELGVDP
jgi:O-methyltransferase involved in polyketide biosynthesis